MSSSYRILFVCLGNICRSPAGENVMNALLLRNKVKGIEIDSAGTASYHIGKAPDKRMAATLEKRGFPNDGVARKFTKEDFERFDLIIPMDHSNRDNVLSLAESDDHKAKVIPFVTFCSSFDHEEVPDPYYGGEDGFAEVIDMMHEGCNELLRQLLAE